MALFQIKVYDKNHGIKEQCRGEGGAEMAPAPYGPGDFIEIESSEYPCPLKLTLDGSLPEALVWLTEERLSFPVPFGDERMPYPPGAFEGDRRIAVSKADGDLWKAYRNLSENPLDRRGETTYYPHCTASVETRGEAIFAARNTIDGRMENTSHGEWPYTSWGDNEDPRAQIRIDFGRPVEIDCAEILIRADFPHDNYWTQAVLTFSDGSRERLVLKKTAESQRFAFAPRTVSWVTMGNLVKSEEESPFPALSQWKFFGRDPGGGQNEKA